MVEVLRKLGSHHVLVAHAEDGLDEISLAAPTRIAELKDGFDRTEEIEKERLVASSLEVTSSVDDIRDAMEGMLAPDRTEVTVGKIEVRNTFKVPKIGTIAGSYVLSGKVKRNAQVNVFREGIKVHTGKITSLKRFKDDAKEVIEGFECGVGIENFQDLRVDDILEVIDVVETKRLLKSND